MAEVGTVYVSVMPTTKGFSKSLQGAGEKGGGAAGKGFNLSFGKLVAGSALGNVISGAVGKVTGAISSSMGAAVSRVDTLNNFPKVMQNLGYGADEADASIKTLTAGIDGMPTSLDGIVSMTQQLAPMCGGLKQATSLSLAMNNMMLASGASTADQSRAMQQYSQMLARGKVELNDWRTLQEVMPGQLNQVAQAMLGAGKNSNDLYEALKNGDVTMQDFNDTVMRLNEEGANGFASFKEQAESATQGIGTAVQNVKNRIGKAIGVVLDHIGQGNISGVINGFSSQFGTMATLVCQFWDGMVSRIDFAGFESAFSGLKDALGSVFSEGSTATSFGEQVGGAVNMLIPVIQGLTPILQGVAVVVKFVAENAMWLLPALLLVMGAFKLGSAIGTAGSFMNAFGNATAAATPKVGANAVEMLKLGVAALALGAGIALACAGITMLVFSAIQLSQAGPMAALALLGLVGAVALFAVGAAALGPALTAGALGFVAFGTAILMVGAGVMLACAGFALLSGALPTVSAYGMSAAAAIAYLGASMLMASPGALALGASLLVLGAGALVSGTGMAVLAVAALAASAGLLLCTAPAMLLGPMLMLAGTGAMQMGAALLIVAVSSLAAVPGLLALAGCVGGVALALGLAVPAFGGLAAALGGSALALSTCAAAMLVIVASCRQAQAASASASNGFTAMGRSAAAATGQYASAASRISSAASDLAFRIQASNSRIQASFNGMRLHIPSPSLGPMPHFSLRGKFDLEAGTVPTIDVNWYAKGGVFNRPSVIGVGEAGTEVAYSADKLLDRFQQTAAEGAGGGWEQVCDLLAMILAAIPRLSQRDLQREIRRTVNG